MDSNRPLSDPEATDELARTTRWIPLVIPLAGALILIAVALLWGVVLA
jgi:hypothetical protein